MLLSFCVVQVLCGAAAGLEYMHACGVIHHDFTSYNLLLNERNGRWTTKVRRSFIGSCGSRVFAVRGQLRGAANHVLLDEASATGPRRDFAVL